MISSTTQAPMFLLKGVFQKTFFLIGLGSATYFTYQQVTTWGNPQAVEGNRSQPLLSKLGAEAFQNFNPFRQSISLPVHSPVVGPAPAAAAPILGAAQPGVPAPALDSTTAPVEGEKKEGEEAIVEDPNAVAPQAFNPNFYSHSLVGSEPASAPKPVVDPNAIDPNSPLNQALGAALNPSSHTQGTVVSYGGPTTVAPAASQSNLTAADVAIITNSSLTITPSLVDNSTTQVSGQVNSGGSWIAQSNISVPYLRWDLTRGIQSTGMTFAPQSASGTSVKFSFTMKLQDLSQTLATQTLDLLPIDSVASVETSGAQTYKVYKFTFADTTFVGEGISSVKVTLVFQNTGQGGATNWTLVAPSPSYSSELKFVRAGNFETASDAWNSVNPQAVPQSSQHFKPDHWDYSFQLQ